jgi:hypothetical protein
MKTMRRTEIVRASSDASGVSMEMMQCRFHPVAATQSARPRQGSPSPGLCHFLTEIGEISCSDQRYFIRKRLEVEKIQGSPLASSTLLLRLSDPGHQMGAG